MIRHTFGILGLFIAGVLLTTPQNADAQVQEIELAYACYVPQVGAVYRIDPNGGGEGELQADCYEATDVKFSWVLGDTQPLLLPNDCTTGEIAHFNGTAWSCADPGETHDHVTAGMLYDLEQIRVEFDVAPAGQNHGTHSYGYARCTEGRKIISGGFVVGSEWGLYASWPSYVHQYWAAQVYNQTSQSGTGSVYAICARIG